MTNSLLAYNHYYLVGIKGVAMTALALILTDMGKTVAGSDTAEVFPTDKLLKNRHIHFSTNFSTANLTNSQVVIYGASHQGGNNPQVVYARKKGLLVLSLAEFVGYLTTQKTTVAVAGCHGKTTTTALISYCLAKAKLDPSYFVGSSGFMDFASGAWGKGNWFAVEADEYLTCPYYLRKAKFLFYHPLFLIVTNLDFDHPDFYADFEAVKKSFRQLFSQLDKKAKLIINGDDSELLFLAKSTHPNYLSYGFKKHNHYQIINDGFKMKIMFNNQVLLSLTPTLLGSHNRLNLASAIVFLQQTKIPLNTFIPFLNEFKGAKRRLELVAKVGQHLVYDDYAHHPAEIKASLAALKNAYPQHKLAVCFQPHTFSRTQALLFDFVRILSITDYLGLLPIFASAREQIDAKVYNDNLIKALPKSLRWTLLKTDSDYENLVKNSQALTGPWLYVTMGAGNVREFAPLIIQALKKYG